MSGRSGRLRGQPAGGFTLIEVLVVVAILALLVAILLPSLAQARESAKIMICKANCKQIATILEMYRTEHKQYVPIMFNYYSNGDPAHTPNPNGHNVPAKGCWLSVALHAYERSIKNMRHVESRKVPGRFFDPQVKWKGADGVMLRDEFEDRLMPAHYACPFQRDRGDGRDIIVKSSNGVEYHEWTGRFDSYHTVLWSNIRRNVRIQAPPPGGAGDDGVAKYSMLTWNKVGDADIPNPPGGWDADLPDNPFFHRYHRRWGLGEIRAVGAASPSEVTISWCAQGEHLALGNLRYNVGSHRTSQGGGCNAIFGDTHVEWVKGTRIGWR